VTRTLLSVRVAAVSVRELAKKINRSFTCISSLVLDE